MSASSGSECKEILQGTIHGPASGLHRRWLRRACGLVHDISGRRLMRRRNKLVSEPGARETARARGALHGFPRPSRIWPPPSARKSKPRRCGSLESGQPSQSRSAQGEEWQFIGRRFAGYTWLLLFLVLVWGRGRLEDLRHDESVILFLAFFQANVFAGK